MKKLLLFLGLAFTITGSLFGQCVPTCSNYAVSSITYTNFTGAGTNVIPSLSPTIDDGYMIAPLGFSFNYYCTTYTSVIICSNGFIQFDLANPPVQNLADPTQSFPSTASPNGMIALNMNDLDATSTGSLTYMTLGTAPNRQFVVSWTGVPIYAYPASLNTGQIVLYETSNLIDIYTGTVTNNSTTNGTQGIENQTGTSGVPVPGRNNVLWSATNSGYRFTYANAPAPMPAINGISSLCAGTAATYSTSTLPGVINYNWSFPAGWYGTSTTSAVSPTAGVSGLVQVSATYTCGTSNASTFSVTSLPAPVVSISSSSAVICSGAVIGLSVTGASTYTLEPNNVVSTIGFTDMPIVSTTYTLYGTDANNCNSVNNPVTMVTVNQSPTVTVNSGSVCLGQQFTITASGADAFTYSSGFPTVTPPNAGVYTYSVVGTNTNGCTAPPALSTVTVAALPTVTITASKMAICKGESVTLTASGANTYVWVNGPSTSTYSSTPLLNTNYTVTGTSTEGCVKNAAISIVVAPCTGIAENDPASALISVYPNPSSGELTVNAAEETSLEVYDMQGRLVLKQQVAAGRQQINLKEVSPGQYFLKATGSSGVRTLILIRE